MTMLDDQSRLLLATLRELAERNAEIGRLTKERDELFLENGKLANTLGADNVKLRAAIMRIDAINDNPAVFNKGINDVCDVILRPELVGAPSEGSTKP